MGQPAIPPGDPSPDSAGRLLARLGLLAVGFALVSVMDLRFEAVREAYEATFQWPMGTWLTFLGSGVVAGLALGFAFFLPPKLGPYRWSRSLVLGVGPLLLLFLGLVVLPDPTRLNPLPGFVREIAARLVGFFGGALQGLSAILFGVAAAAGFAEPRARAAGVAGPVTAGSPDMADRGPDINRLS